MRKITILGLVLGFIFSSFGQMELVHKAEYFWKDGEGGTLNSGQWNHTGLFINGDNGAALGTIFFGGF